MKDDFTLYLIFIALLFGFGELADSANSIDRAQWRQVYWQKVAAQKECQR